VANVSEAEVGSGEKEPVEDGKPSLVYWKSQLKAYDNAAEPWKRDVDAAWDEYTNEEQRGKIGEKSNSSRFPLFWSCVRTIQPAFYSRTPVVVTEKAFKEMRDPVARLAAIMYERLGKYAVKTSGFDRAMGLAVTHFIMSEKATVRVVFDSAITSTEKRSYYQQVMPPAEGPDGHIMSAQPYYVGEDGQQYDGELEQDEDGRYFSSEVEESIDYLSCETEPWHYKDARHTPNARHQGELDWISFDTKLRRQEVADAFGDEVAEALTYSPMGSGREQDKGKEVKGLPAHYTTITEIWDLKKRKVYYLSDDYGQWLQHKNNPGGDDPYKLKHFFPCAPFMLGTFGADDMFTRPAYVQLKDFIEQVHGAFDRLRRLILAMKKRGAYDSQYAALAELNGIGDEGQYIAVDGLEELLGKGRKIEEILFFFPTKEIAEAVTQLKDAVNDLEQKVYDLWGIPDIYRGITDPNETLGAQQLKGKHMSVRFSVLQREVQRLARDTLEIICDLYLGKCPDNKLLDIMGFRYMSPEEQRDAPQALQLLKDDEERCIRLEIETDSTITQNMNADIEQKNYLAKTVFEGIGALKDINPAFMPVAAHAVELGIKSLQQGKLLEGELEQAIEGMKQAAANPQPQPDPQMVKVQAQMQLEQQKGAQQAQLNQQKAQQEIQLKYITAQADIAIEQYMARTKAYLEERKAAQGMQLEQLDAQHQQELALLEGQLMIFKEKLKGDIEMKKADAKIENDNTMTEAKAGAAGKPKEGGKGLNLHIGPQIKVNG